MIIISMSLYDILHHGPNIPMFEKINRTLAQYLVINFFNQSDENYSKKFRMANFLIDKNIINRISNVAH